MNTKFLKTFCLSVIAGLICSSTPALAQSTSVPSTYSTEYAELDQILDSFIANMNGQPAATHSPPIGSWLDAADGGNGLSLLKSTSLASVQTQLSRFKQMGVRSVQFCPGFPVCCQEFWTQKMNAPSDLKTIIAFYQQVVQLCHANGLTVVAEAHPMYPGSDNFTQSANAFTRSLTPAQFQQYMTEHVSNIASLIRPDVVSIVAEPDTDLSWTNQSAYGSAQSLAAFVQVVSNAVAQANATNHTQVEAAAGAASWMTYAQNYDSALYGIKTLGAIDIHTYFVGSNDLQTATSLAQNAHSAGKNVVVSECWLGKAGTGMPPYRPEANQPTIERAVASFSFWEPLDEKWISAMSKWASLQNIGVFCFSYPQQLFAYLNYSTYSSDSDTLIFQAEKQAEQQAMAADQFSPVGQRFSQLVGSN